MILLRKSRKPRKQLQELHVMTNMLEVLTKLISERQSSSSNTQKYYTSVVYLSNVPPLSLLLHIL